METTIKTFRKSKRISQTELAHNSGMNHCVLNRIENGWVKLNPKFIKKIVSGYKKLGIKPNIKELSS